jgi:hypothetical protein
MTTPREPFEHLDKHAIAVEPVLRELLERCVRDERFRQDLDLCGFQPWPSPSDEIDCLNPWLFVIAMNGGGSAYGLYVHPDAIRDGVAPWAYWEHEDDGIYWLADDSDTFFRGFLQSLDWVDDQAQVERIRAVFRELGIRVDDGPVEMEIHPESTGPNRPWLPPAEDDLLTTGDYLAMLDSDPDAAELGLLGVWHYRREPEAGKALDAYYERRGWKPPRSYDPTY